MSFRDFLLAAALIALAYFATATWTGNAQSAGPWQVSSGSGRTAWRINVVIGETFFCVADDTALSVLSASSLTVFPKPIAGCVRSEELRPR